MKFPDLLLQAVGRSEIPLRFEPGADESMAAPVLELLRAWLRSHRSPSDAARNALIQELLDEVDGSRDVPA
jgi:hypothetical protein